MLLEYSYESKPSGYGCDGPPRRSSYIHLAHHRYEHPGQSPRLRIQAVIAGARLVGSNQLLSSVMIRLEGESDTFTVNLVKNHWSMGKKGRTR